MNGDQDRWTHENLDDVTITWSSWRNDAGENGSSDRDAIVNRLFAKHYRMPNTFTRQFPDPEIMWLCPSWEMDNFSNLKESLNYVKNKLDNFNLNAWYKNNSQTNPAQQIIQKVRNIGSSEQLSLSWLKFYELLNECTIISQKFINNGKFYSVHLCEDRGSFISALNHFIFINKYNIEWDWIGVSLNPYHEGIDTPDLIDNDKFMLYTLDHWFFGKDFTGDINQKNFYMDLYARVKNRFGTEASLVTADLSIECFSEPNEQENLNLSLCLTEMMVALMILDEGGTFVVKMFTMFECNTLCQMYMLNCFFDSVQIKKPLICRPGNSEVYVICSGYKGLQYTEPWIHKFFKTIDHALPSEFCLFPLSSIRKKFIYYMYDCSEFFSGQQIQYLEKNIKRFTKKKFHDTQQLFELQSYVAQKYINRYKIKQIDTLLEIKTQNNLQAINKYNFPQWKLKYLKYYSYSKIIRQMKLKGFENAKLIENEINSICYKWRYDSDVVWFTSEDAIIDLSDFNLQLGKPVNVIQNSQFCMTSIIACYKRARLLQIIPTEDVTKRRDKFWLQIPKKSINRRLYVCDVTWTNTNCNTNNNQKQFESLMAILEFIEKLQNADSLLLIGYPLLTQVNVGIFYILINMFSKTGIIKINEMGCALVFYSMLKNSHVHNLISLLRTTKNMMEPLVINESQEALISLFQVNKLIFQSVYEKIIAYNCSFVINEVKKIVASYLLQNENIDINQNTEV